MSFLYEKIDSLREAGYIESIPSYIEDNINPEFELRPYQIQAFENFVTYSTADSGPARHRRSSIWRRGAARR